MQKECLALLKSYVKSDSNLKAIALILRSFRSSLRENYLSPDETNELYAYTTVLAVPLKTVFEVPIAALQLLQTRCEIFNTMILKGA